MEQLVVLPRKGDLRRADDVLQWMLQQKDPNLDDVIEELSGDALEELIDSAQFLVVYFYRHATSASDDIGSADAAAASDEVLAELEKIDDDADDIGVDFVKTGDLAVARKFGIRDFPALIYFEKGVPSFYEGNLEHEEEVLRWIVQNKNEDRIETVNRQMLEELIEDSPYLAVYFCAFCFQLLTFF